MNLINVRKVTNEVPTFVWQLNAGWGFADYKLALTAFNQLLVESKIDPDQTVEVIVAIADSGEPHRILEMACWENGNNGTENVHKQN
ncbi:MAG: hypothetical protein AAF846_29880 [Chloroflexota bacterium]